MTEISIIKILYTNRIRLLIVSLAIGAAAGGLSLLRSNTYQSTAAISVQQPEVPITGEVSPLRVEVLRSLVESARIQRIIYDELREDGLVAKDLPLADFKNMLSTRVQLGDGRERTLLPLVKLTVTSSDPALSKEIANRWAQVVLDQTREIYRRGVDELADFTATMYEGVNRSLIESEERFAEVRSESNLAGNHLSLEQNREVYSRLMENVDRLEERAATGNALLKRLESRLAEQEIDGIWIGDILARNGEPDREDEPPATGSLADRITRTIRSLARNEEALAEFEKNSQIEFKRSRAAMLKTQIDELSRQILEARVELSRVEPNYQRLKKELEDLSPTITLKKALGDEATLILRDRDRRGEETPKMETEISNPVYEKILAETIALSGQAEGIGNKIERGGERLEELRSEIIDLNRELATLTARQRVFRTAIDRDQRLLNFFAVSYRDERQKYETLKQELELGEAELAAIKVSLENLSEKIAGLEKKVYEAENAVLRKERVVANLSDIRASLAGRAEEVALLRVTMENVSRSGTVLLYGAEIDPVKVGPRRGRIVLISILLGFLVCSMFLVIGEAVRQIEPDEPGGQAPPPSGKAA